MGMNLKIATAVLALHWVSAIHAEVPVFGVPLGGVLSKPLKVCNSDIDKRPDLCWTGKPGLEKSDAWVEQLIQKGIDRGWPLQVQKGTAIGVSAFMYATKREELNWGTLCANAVHLAATEKRNGHLG